MKKTYWWRILVFIVGIVTFIYSWLASYGDKMGLCNVNSGIEECTINYNPYIKSLFILSISLMVVTLFLFIISDRVFLKWLRFAIIWTILLSIAVILTPEYSSGWIPLNPDRQQIAIFLSSLFVILSLVKISWDSWKEKKQSRL